MRERPHLSMWLLPDSSTRTWWEHSKFAKIPWYYPCNSLWLEVGGWRWYIRSICFKYQWSDSSSADQSIWQCPKVCVTKVYTTNTRGVHRNISLCTLVEKYFALTPATCNLNSYVALKFIFRVSQKNRPRPSILCVTHEMSHTKRNHSVGWTVLYEMMYYKWYLMVLSQYMTILAGTWSV